MKDERTSVLGRYSLCFAVNDLLVTRSQVSKLISNEISKYELKGTVDYLFHRTSLSMAAIKIVQKLQIHSLTVTTTKYHIRHSVR